MTLTGIASLVIAAGSDHLFGSLAEVLGQPGLTSDPRFAVRRSRVANQAELKSIIEMALPAFPIAHWLVSLEEAGVLPPVPRLDEHRDEILRFARGDAPLDS